MPFDEAFLKDTAKVWQLYSKIPLTLEDARDIADNTVGYFTTLIRWEREREMKEVSNGSSQAR